MDTNTVFLIFIVILFLILIIYEYFDHDCLPHKQCYHRIPSPNAETETAEIFISLHDMLRSNLDVIFWRQALLAGIISTFLVIIFLYGRLPLPLEFLFIGLLVFMCVYFVLSWTRFHFHSPNTLQIERGLSILEERINSNKKK